MNFGIVDLRFCNRERFRHSSERQIVPVIFSWIGELLVSVLTGGGISLLGRGLHGCIVSWELSRLCQPSAGLYRFLPPDRIVSVTGSWLGRSLSLPIGGEGKNAIESCREADHGGAVMWLYGAV